LAETQAIQNPAFTWSLASLPRGDDEQSADSHVIVPLRSHVGTATMGDLR
jgi:hypothetical protein